MMMDTEKKILKIDMQLQHAFRMDLNTRACFVAALAALGAVFISQGAMHKHQLVATLGYIALGYTLIILLQIARGERHAFPVKLSELDNWRSEQCRRLEAAGYPTDDHMAEQEFAENYWYAVKVQNEINRELNRERSRQVQISGYVTTIVLLVAILIEISQGLAIF